MTDSPNPVDVYVGKRVRLRRKFSGLSQMQLAEKIDVTFQQVQKYERGANRISASKMYEIAKALSVSPTYFYNGYGDDDNVDGEISANEVKVMGFLATSEGLELAQLFPQIKSPAQRRQILSLVNAMAED